VLISISFSLNKTQAHTVRLWIWDYCIAWYREGWPDCVDLVAGYILFTSGPLSEY